MNTDAFRESVEAARVDPSLLRRIMVDRLRKDIEAEQRALLRQLDVVRGIQDRLVAAQSTLRDLIREGEDA